MTISQNYSTRWTVWVRWFSEDTDTKVDAACKMISQLDLQDLELLYEVLDQMKSEAACGLKEYVESEIVVRIMQ